MPCIVVVRGCGHRDSADADRADSRGQRPESGNRHHIDGRLFQNQYEKFKTFGSYSQALFQRAWTSATLPPGSWTAARMPTLSFWRTWWPPSILSKWFGRLKDFFFVSRVPQKQEDVPLPRLKAKCPDAHKCIINVSHFTCTQISISKHKIRRF
jgi:hypothetical protein